MDAGRCDRIGLTSIAPAGRGPRSRAAPAQAFPEGESLVVLSYYQGSELVGQRWHGCGQSPGGWGEDSGRIVPSFPPGS
jgi:hypothetical protein